VSGFAWGAFAVNLGWAAAASLAVMLVTFAIAVRRGLHRIVDIAWGIAFTAVAVVSCAASAGEGDPGRRYLVTALTALWGLRLAGHIARRGRGHGEDPRYEQLLGKAPGSRNLYALRMVYLLQGALVWLVSLPVQAAQYVPDPMTAFAGAGTALVVLGVCFEAVGDAQLARFKADPAHKGRIMDQGLWRYTRHPNYFGDACVWWGLWLVAAEQWQGWPAVLAPLVMTLVLTKGTGAGETERRMKDRPGFADYVARTSGFLPLPPRKPRT
jgi:steroid 5-alpha reductase family enzyme